VHQRQPVQPPRPAGVVRFYNFLAPGNNLRDDVLKGLGASPRFIPMRWSFNEPGIRVHRIMSDIPAWYQTRDESALVRAHLDELAQLIGATPELIEIGPAASPASLLLIDRIEPSVHVQVDSDPVALTGASKSLAGVNPWLNFCGILADPARPLVLPEFVGVPIRRKVVWLPASALTRFTPDQLYELLGSVRRMIGRTGNALVSVDLKKDHKQLDAAYNDTDGIVSLFNVNLLLRINDELQCDFQPSRFAYHAGYNELKNRVEMTLVSRLSQFVRIGEQRFDFDAGDALVTGIASLYTSDEFITLARDAGLVLEKVWNDEGQHLGLHWMKAA
jgi:dimethylhistidine N-methyltransferase